METAFAASLLMLAVAIWIEAHERRAVFADMKASARNRNLAKGAGWALALIALVLMAQPQGWERGIPIWLGAATAAGIVGLLIDARFPGRHVEYGVGAAALAGLVLMTAIAGAAL